MGEVTERWVFGYGSLMWQPGFPFLERRRAVCYGRRRAFCVYSVHHRGTPARKGLVLGLAQGGSVVGAAYRVAEADWPAVYAYLMEREQPTETYIEHYSAARLDDGRVVRALTFVSDRGHPQWAGDLSLDSASRSDCRRDGAFRTQCRLSHRFGGPPSGRRNSRPLHGAAAGPGPRARGDSQSSNGSFNSMRSSRSGLVVSR